MFIENTKYAAIEREMTNASRAAYAGTGYVQAFQPGTPQFEQVCRIYEYSKAEAERRAVSACWRKARRL